MKYNCFESLKKISDISLKLCEKSGADPIILTEESAKQKNTCITQAAKQFLPQIDREDIIMLAFMLHELNTNLAVLYLFLPADNSFKLSGYTKKACLLINGLLEKKLLIPTEDILLKRDKLFFEFIKDYKDSLDLSFNTKALIKTAIFDKIRMCTDIALNTVDQLCYTKIKNS